MDEVSPSGAEIFNKAIHEFEIAQKARIENEYLFKNSIKMIV